MYLRKQFDNFQVQSFQIELFFQQFRLQIVPQQTDFLLPGTIPCHNRQISMSILLSVTSLPLRTAHCFRENKKADVPDTGTVSRRYHPN